MKSIAPVLTTFLLYRTSSAFADWQAGAAKVDMVERIAKPALEKNNLLSELPSQ